MATILGYTKAAVDTLLSGKAALVHTHLTSSITGLDAALAGKSAVGHTHPTSDIPTLAEEMADYMNTVIQAGDNMTKVYDDTGNTLTLSSTGGGSSAQTLEIPAIKKLRDLLILAPNRPTAVVFNGSSTTGGGGASATELRYTHLVTRALQRAYAPGITESAIQVSNSGPTFTENTAVGINGYVSYVDGATSNSPSSGSTQIAALNPEVIIHQFGGNDWDTSMAIATYKSNMESRCTTLDGLISTPHVHVLLWTQQRAGSGTLPWLSYRDALKEVADADPTNRIFVNWDDIFTIAGNQPSDPLGLIG